MTSESSFFGHQNNLPICTYVKAQAKWLMEEPVPLLAKVLPT